MKKVNIGLDVGIASVGWSILDADSFEIINHGVRLFDTIEHPKDSKLKNETRREKRSLRRQLRRHKNLKKDFIKFLIQNKVLSFPQEGDLVHDFVNYFFERKNFDILKLRLKGLTMSLAKDELIAVLYWYLANRGYKYELAGEQEAQLEVKFDVAHKFPAEIQQKFLDEENYFRGQLNRRFSTKDYLKELEQIFSHTPDKWNLKPYFMELFKRQRRFEEGPGPRDLKAFNKIKDPQARNAMIASPFNRLKIDPKTQTVAMDQTMWDKTVGRCIYDHHFRAPKEALSALVFNLLNDLNNLKIPNHEIAREDKLEALKLAFESEDNFKKITTYLATKYDVKVEDLEGFRVTKNKKPLLTPLTSIHALRRIISKDNAQISFAFSEFYDQQLKPLKAKIIDELILTLSKTKELTKREEALTSALDELKWVVSPATIKILAQKLPTFNATHALSNEFITGTMLPLLLEEPKNQMRLIFDYKIKPLKQINAQARSYLDLKWLDSPDFIASPTTKRAIRQTLRVLNRIIKLHKHEYQVNNIVIEMARDLNRKAEKERIRQLQKLIEQRNTLVRDEIKDMEEKNGQKVYGQAFLKFLLYKQQKGHDAYTGEYLDKDRVVFDPSYCDIDHIIPWSQSFIDGIDNKALTLADNNSAKGNHTPYQWFNDESRFNQMQQKWIAWFHPDHNGPDHKSFCSRKKIEYLTSRLDYSRPENAIGFIERNLVDTRYATREILNHLQLFIQNVPQAHMMQETKIKTVNGKMTSFIRKLVENPQNYGPLKRPEGIPDGSFNEKTKLKERIYNGHHAEDATIVVHAALKNIALNKLMEKIISSPYMSSQEKQKIANNQIYHQWNSNQIDFVFLGSELDRTMPETKFSYMLNKRSNYALSNETIYGAKWVLTPENAWVMHKVESMPLEKLNNPSDAKKFFSDDYKYTIPMKTHDLSTWKALKNQYLTGDPKKPFGPFNSKGQIEINGKKIGKINIIKEIKNPDEVIAHQIDNHGRISSFKETLNWFSLHLYKNSLNKNVVIPINALNAKVINQEIQINNQVLDKQKQNNKIPLTAKPMILHYNSIILDPLTKKTYRVVGHGAKDNRLQLKNLSLSNEKQQYYTINTKILGWIVISIDELGNNYHYQFYF